MANELAVIERNLNMVEPQLHRALAGAMPSSRLIQLMLTACERSKKLMECNPQSIMNCAISAATLGLEPDGVTGQFFPLPFNLKGRMTAQSCIGYRGYNSLAARRGSDMTITGKVVREGDAFDYKLGTKAFVDHTPKLGNTGRIIAAWAIAESLSRPPIISVLSIDEIMAVKERSPGAKGDSDGFSPWNDPKIGFPAMAEKTAKRRLSRSTPLITAAPQYMWAARMEEAFDEQGKPGWLDPDRGLVINHDPLPERESANETPSASDLMSGRQEERREQPVEARSEPQRPSAEDRAAEFAAHEKALTEAAQKGGNPELLLAWSRLSQQWRRDPEMAAVKDALKAKDHD